MIGLDTNILLRLWLDDDPAQNRRIDQLLQEHGRSPGSLMVCNVVLAEAVWTLQSAYAQDKTAQLLALQSLLNEPAFAFEDRPAVASAVANFANSRCGFADCLIAARQASLGCDFTATFDKRMKGIPGVSVV